MKDPFSIQPLKRIVTDAKFSVFAVVIIEMVLYAPSLKLGLVADDFVFEQFSSRSFVPFWTSSSDNLGHFRPVSYSLKLILYEAFEENPLGWHVTNVVVHLSTCFLLLSVLKVFIPGSTGVSKFSALLLCILFQVHPAGAQNVLWASGFSELLAVFWFFAAFRVLIAMPGPKISKSYHLFFYYFLLVLSFLSKESALAFPIVLIVLHRLHLSGDQIELFPRRHGLGAVLVAAVTALLILVLGWRVLVDQSGNLTLQNVTEIFVKGFAMIIVPLDALSVAEILVYMPGELIILAALIILWLCVMIIMKWRLISANLLLIVSALSATLVIFAFAGYIAQRLVYVPIASMIVLLTVLAKSQIGESKKKKNLILVGAGVYIALTGISTVNARSDWFSADDVAKKVRNAFINFHTQSGKGQYTFLALPNRIRQAWIIGEPGTDFNAALREKGSRERISMNALVRVVSLVRVEPFPELALIVIDDRHFELSLTDSAHYLLFGNVNSAISLPVGSKYVSNEFTIEVLGNNMPNRASHMRMRLNTIRLSDVVVFNGQSQSFSSGVPVH